MEETFSENSKTAGRSRVAQWSALMALGNGLLTPTLSGMSSRHVHGRAQGRVLGRVIR